MIYSDLLAILIPIGYLSVVYQPIAALPVSSVTELQFAEQDRPNCGLYISVTAPFTKLFWVVLIRN